jgi:ADP-ribosylglycohydrolase
MMIDNIDEQGGQKSRTACILGAIAGDVIGSVYEFHNERRTDIDLFGPKTTFTDDSVLTVATMDVLLNGGDYTKTYQSYGRKYPNRGWGGNFHYWIHAAKPEPYNSFGNGSAMRVSPAGWCGGTLQEVLAEAKKSAEVSHNHSEGIKGAQATAAAVFLARQGKGKGEIKKYIEDTFHYNLDRKVALIREDYDFDETCQGSVPEAIIAFLESSSYEDAVRLAVSLGGDSDTIACISGGIAGAFYGEVPPAIAEKVIALLPPEFIGVIKAFSKKWGEAPPPSAL